MTVEKLLKPRWEVIASFPDSKYKVGDIEDRDWTKYVNGEDDADGIEWKISDFPHLFRKIQWWEKRTVEEMPEYLKFHDNEVIKVKNWSIETSWCQREDGGGCSLGFWSKGFGYIPATADEYTSYIKNKQP